MSYKVKVISTTNSSNNEIVKTAVSEYESLLNYEPKTNEDLIALLSFTDNFLLHLWRVDGGNSSAGTSKDGPGRSTDEDGEKWRDLY
ncbi:hypothetical protein SADUNF_Sadunf14G0075700 [Salix dunnii]|uniref:Uncharacterized protein n=1 Tax=Salix dunnii TaxID=1413687 RepID=A0A835MJS2_9ROSI|nr:hypothetical protein SADUNF_Sadunf14G0075700 [Salix dunnii]